MPTAAVNVMSIDLEDWFCVQNLTGVIRRDDWPKLDYRVEKNTLRLLEMDPAVQVAVTDGHITEGHARALGALDPTAQVQLLGAVVSRELSVRQTEELARRLKEPREARRAGAPRSQIGADLERVEEELRRSLGTKVSLARTRRGGRIVIEYYSDEDLSRLYERLTGGTA